jgi:hypothetical protein
VELFGYAFAEVALTEVTPTSEELSRAWDSVLADVLARHPGTPCEFIALAAGIALGRFEASKECGCLKKGGSPSLWQPKKD